MDADSRGDFGFYESMVAMMAVTMVLAAFLAVAIGSISVSADPTEGIDGSMLTGTVEDGVFVPGYEEYVASYMESRGLSGISVSVQIAKFCDEAPLVSYGTFDGETWSRTFTSLVGDEEGRTLVAIFEVTACARATGVSSRWWTR